MTVSVWDTYVKRTDGKLMHFDILVPSTLNDELIILNFGKTYLENKRFKTENISIKACNFCHIERATDTVLQDLKHKRFSIIELENCH
ncbi:DUF2024 family protein [Aestuariivivens insulae]|uniref:DUF2024 family protein n=1 Tax=Aestuariivivens insulae TaxID=1621988 RepID=UPI001F56C3A4|nr:DUF2024 family protein [Aestuariivivens insulae]